MTAEKDGFLPSPRTHKGVASNAREDVSSPLPVRTPTSGPSPRGPLSPRTAAVRSPLTLASSSSSHRHRTWSPIDRQLSSPTSDGTTSTARPSSPPMETPTSELLDFEATSGITIHPECLDRYLVNKRACATCRKTAKAAAAKGGEIAMCRFLVDMLTRFSAEHTMAVKGLRSVRGRLLTGPPVCKDLLREAGLCDVILGLLSPPPPDAEVLSEVCETVAALSTDSSANQERLREVGCCVAVCEALRDGVAGGNLRLCIVAAQACANLAWKSPPGQAALLAADVAPLLVSAMTNFPESADLLMEACGAIADISYRNSQSQEAFGRAGACIAVCSAASTFPMDRFLQLRAMQAIANLGFMHQANQLRLAEEGAATLLCFSLNQHQDDRDLHCEGCRAIDNIAWSCPANQAKLGQAGACRILAHTLTNFGKHKVATLQACRAAGTLAASHAVNQELLAKAGVCVLVIESLARYAGDRNIICECCDCMVNLIYHLPANQAMLVEAGAAMTVCEAMARFVTERDVQLRGARVLANLVSSGTAGIDTVHQDSLAIAGACEILSDALKAFSDDRNLVLYACRTVANLCCEHAANQERLGRAGCCGSVLKTLKKFSTDRDIQWYGVGAVANLAFNSPTNAASLGPEACHLVTSSLSHFADKDDRQVVLQSIRAMVILTKSSKTNQDALVTDAKACPTICKMMDRYKEDRAIVTFAVRLVDHLASDSAQAAHVLAEAGACRLVCDMLRRFPDRDGVVQACRAIVALTWAKTQYKDPFLDAGACDLLCGVMARHAADPEVRCVAVEAIANLAWGNVALQDGLREAGALRLVPDAMSACPGDVAFVSECLRAISSLCHHNTASQARLAEASAVRAACDAMRRFPVERLAALHGLRALTNLAHHSKENQEQLRAEGAPVLIVEALRIHAADKGIAVEACRAVTSLAWRSLDLQEALRKAGVCSAICDAVHAQPSDRALRIQSCRAFTSLAHRNSDCQTDLGEAGACEVIHGAVTEFSQDDREAMAQEAAETIFHLALHHPRNQERLGRAALCEWLAGCLAGDAPAKSRDRALAALDAIASIASENGQTQSVMLSANVPSGTIQVLLQSRGDKELEVACLHTLSALSSGHQPTQAWLVDHGGAMPVIAKTMAAHPDDREVQLKGCEAVLGMITLHAAGRKDLLPSGAIEAICQAMTSVPHDDRLACRACHVLSLVPYSISDQEIVGGKHHACDTITAALVTFATNGGVVTQALAAMAALSQDHPANQQRLADTCGPLLTALGNFHHDPDIQRHGITALANLAVNHTPNASRLGTEACRLVVTTLRHCLDKPQQHDSTTVLQAMCAIAALARATSSNRTVLFEVKACQCTCEAMERHLSDRAVALHGVKLLEYMASDGGHHHASQLLAEARVGGLIADLLQQYPEDREVMLYACRAILAIGAWYKVASVRSAFAATSIPGHLRSALQRYKTDRKVLMGVLEAIAILGRHGRDMQDSLASHDVPVLLLEAMTTAATLPDHQTALLARCLRAMASLAYRNHSVQSRLLNGGAVLISANAMTRFPDDHELQLCGLRACATLSDRCPRGQDELLAKAGMDKHVICAMQQTTTTGSNGVDLKVRALQLAGAMVRENPTCQTALIKAGLLRALASIFVECVDRACQVEACRLVLILSLSGPEGQHAVGSEQACLDGVVRVLKASVDDAEVQMVATEALFNLTLGHEENQSRLAGSVDALQGLISTIRRHLSDEDLLPFALGVVVNLTDRSPAARHHLGEASGCETIHQVLVAHKTDPAVLCCACRAITTICLDHTGNKARFVSSKTSELIEAALSSFPDHRDLQMCGCEAINCLSSGDPSITSSSSSDTGQLPSLPRATMEQLHIKDLMADALAVTALSVLPAVVGDDLQAAGTSSAILDVIKEVSTRAVEEGQHEEKQVMIQLAGQSLRALTKLSKAAGDGCEDGISVVVLDCLKRFPLEVEVMGPGLEVLVGAGMAEDGAAGEGVVPAEKLEAMVKDLAPVLCEALASTDAVLLKSALDAMGLLLRRCTDRAQDVLAEHLACAAVARLLSRQDLLPPVDVTCRALEVLGLLATEHEENRDRLDEVGAGDALIKLLQTRERLPESVKVDVIRAAVELAHDNEAFTARLGEAGMTTAVLDLMSTERQQVKLQILGCYAILVLSEDRNTRHAFQDEGATSVVVESLLAFPADEGVQSVGLEALKVLGLGDDVHPAFEQAVLSTLRLLPDRPAHVVMGLKLLTRLAELVSMKQRPGLTLSLETLSIIHHHLAAPGVLSSIQHLAISALAAALHALISSRDGSQALSLLLASDPPLPPLLTAAVVRMPEDAPLACHVATVLANIAVGGKASYAAHDWLREHGAVDLVIQLLNRWGHHQAPILPLLYAFITASAAVDEDSQSMLGAACAAMLTDVTWQAGQDDVVRCRAIGALAAGNRENQQRLGGACRLLVEKVLANARASEKLKTKALEAASHLCYHHVENQGRLVEAGIVGVVLGLLTTHADQAPLQLQGIGLLRNLMWEAPVALEEAIAASGLVKVLCTAMHQHGPGSPELHLYGLAAIAGLAISSSAARDQLVAAGACQLLVSIHDGRAKALLKASYALKAIAALAGHSTEASSQLVQVGACSFVHEVMSCLLQENGRPVAREAADVGGLALHGVLELSRGSAAAKDQLGEVGVCNDVVRVLERYRINKAVHRYGWDAMISLGKGHGVNKTRLMEAGSVELITSFIRQPSSGGGVDLSRITKIATWLNPDFETEAVARQALEHAPSFESDGNDDDDDDDDDDEKGRLGMTIGAGQDLSKTLRLSTSHVMVSGAGGGADEHGVCD